MNFKNMFEKHILPVFLSLIMVLSMAPMTVFAADGNQASVTVNGTETEYATVQEAFDAAKKLTDPCTVKVLQSFKSSMVLGVTFTAEDNCDITLDVNGFDMYNRNTRDQASASMFTFEKGTNAHLTVVNNAENRETYGGIFYYPNGTDISNSVFHMEGGYLTIEDVFGDGIKNKTSNYDKISGSILYLDGGNVTINGSKFGEDNSIVPLYVKSGNLTVNGGTFITQQGNALRIAEGFDGKVSLSGGKFSSTFTSSDLDKMGNFVQVYSIPSILREDGGKVDDLLAKGFTYQKDADDKDAESALYREISVVPEPGVKYIAADGTEQSCTEYTELTDASTGDLSGWYAVTGTVDIGSAIGVTGDNTLNLILCDGAQLNLTRPLYMIRGTTLNIYGQSGGTGTLIVESSTCQPAIGIMAGFAGGTVTVNIYGGTVTAKTAEGAQPIGLVPDVTSGKVNVNIAAGMKCVKTDDQSTAYAYDNTDGTSITITKCTEHKWSYTNITNDTHDQTCDLCGTTETDVAHTTAGYKYFRADLHSLICACGKGYGTEYHTYTYAPNSDGLTHTATCKCEYAVDDLEHTYKGEDEICICGAVHSATYDGKNYALLQSAIDAAAPVGGTVTLARQINENVVVTDGTVTIDLGGNRWSADISYSKKGYVPLTVNGGNVTLKNGNLFQGSSTSTYETGIVINDGSVTVEGDARVMGGVPDRNTQCPSITLNGGALTLKEGAALLSGLQVPEGKTLADYLPEGTAFVKCSYDYDSNTLTVSDPQEFVPDVYTANKITERMVIVSHTHDFSGSACPCGFNCDHSTVDTAAGKCETCGKQLEAAIKYNDGAVIGFDSFISALDSVQSNMTEEVTVVLLQNYELNSKYILDRSNNIKLDLNTNTISGIGGFVVNADSKLTLSNGNLSEDFTVEAAGGDVTVSADIGNVGRLGFTNKESKVAVLGGNFNSLDILFTDTESLKNINLSGGYFNDIAFMGDGKTVVITDLLEAGYALKDNKGILKTNPDGLVPYGLTVSANTYFAEIEVVPCEHSEVNESKGYCNFCGKLYAGKITDKNGAVRYVEKLQNDDFADDNTVKLMQSVGIIAPGSSCTIEMNGRAADMVNFLVPNGTLTLKGYGNIGTVNLGYDDIDSTLVIEDAAYWMRIEIGTLFVNKTTNTKLNGGQFGNIERKDGGFVEDLLADDHAFFNREWEMPEYIAGKTSLTKTYYIAEHYHWFIVNIDGETQCQDCGMPCHHTTIGADGKCEDVCQRQIYTAVLTKADGNSANYEAFADAWTAAIENEGSTLKLLCDITLNNAEDGIIAQSGKFTFDLNGNTVSGEITNQLLTVSGTADVTVKNGKLINTFSVDRTDINNAYANAMKIDGGTVTLDQVELISGHGFEGARSYAAYIFSGSLTVVNGTFTGALAVGDIWGAHPSVKITSATLHNGIIYGYLGTTDFDYARLKAIFADGSMLFDKDGKYIDIEDEAYWQIEGEGEDVYVAFVYGEECVIKPHTHNSYVDGKCAECDYACPHDSGINDREAGYFEKAICSICHCEYGDFAPDTTAPTGEIKIKERSWWQSLLNTISFGIFYKEEITVTITADDDSYTQPGYDETKHSVKIEYLISAEALSEEVVKKCGFNEYDGAFGISDEDQYVIYAKLTDHAGNEAYASTDGFEIDKTAPVIENMVDGGHYTYCRETRLKISDKNIDKATLDGREQSLNSDGELYLRAFNNKEQTLVVTDKAGNTLTVYITGYTKHDVDAETLTCRYCGVAATAKVTADDFVGYYATLTEALNAGLSDQRENVVVTMLRTVAFGDPARMRVSLWSCPTSFTLDLNGYTLGGDLFNIGGGYYGTLTVISSRPGGALLTTVEMNSEDAVLIMGEGLDGITAMTGIVHIKGTLKINHGKYDQVHVSSSEKKTTELSGGEFVRIDVTAEGLTCADLLAPEYRYDGISYADAKVTSLENVTVVPCEHASLDENGYCADCGFHLVLSVEKDGVTKNFDTFEDAIRYAEQNEGCTVKLLQDVTLCRVNVGSLISNYYIYLGTGTYTLDLAGKALTIGDGGESLQGLTVTGGCDLTVTDTVGGGKIKSSRWGEVFEVRSDGHLTIERGDYTELSRVLANGPDSLTIKGGEFSCVASREGSDSVSPFAYLADGCAFMLSSGAYANESNVKSEYISGRGTMYRIENVTVVPAPLTIDEQPTDIEFYLTSKEADKYVKLVISTIEEWRGKQFRMTFEKEDGTVIQENSVTAFDKQEISVSIVNFTASDSGSYRIKLEINGYVLYSDTFNITVAECLHSEYDKTTNKCTQCGCTLTAAIVNGDKTTGYVTFAEALAAAQTDENKGCTLKLLTDVSGNVAVKSGSFTLDTASTLIDGKLNVAKGADLTVIGGRITGNVICAKGGKLTASNTYFEGTINCVGEGSFSGCKLAGTVSGKSSLTLTACEISDALSISGFTKAESCNVSGEVTINNGGSLKSYSGTYKNSIFLKSGGTLDIAGGTYTGTITAESGSTLTVSNGVCTDLLIGKDATAHISGGQFTNITVQGKSLNDCLTAGLAYEDMNSGDVIDGRVGIAGDVKVVRHAHNCIWKTDTHEKLCGCGYVEAVDTEAPVISGIENYAEYYGPTEFTVTDANDFTVWMDGEQITLVNGKYTAEPDNQEHTITATDIAGNTVTYRVSFYKIYNVTLPTGAGYTIVRDTIETTVRHGFTYDFIVQINHGYSKTADFKVLANGNKLDELMSDANSASFVIRNVSEDLVITVEGVADITAPEVEVNIRGNSFKEFLNRITFGLFFKETQSVQVKANDFGSGIYKVEYLMSETAFSDKDAITGDWTELTLNDDRQAWFDIESDQKVFVYVRVTDNSGNITVVNSDGVVVYTDAEAITETVGIKRLDNTDASFDVKLNGNTVAALYNGDTLIASDSYTVSADGTITLKDSYLSTLAAGEYTIRVEYNPMGVSFDSGDEPSMTSLKLTVEKKTPELTLEPRTQKTYDGDPIDPSKIDWYMFTDGARTWEYKPVDADDTAYTTTAPKNVGEYTVRLTTAETDNFEEGMATALFVIAPKEITIIGAAVESSKVYDGTTDAKITNAGTPSDNYDGDDLTIVAGKATYDNKNVGTGKTVTFTEFALAGDAADNYKLIAQPTSVTADITVKEITINGATVESSKIYDGTTDAKITSAGAPSDNYDGDDLTIVECSASYDNKNVGTGKTVTFTGFSLAGDAATNYKLIAQPTSVTADITVKEITINGATVENSKIYDGTTDAKITSAGAPSDNYDGDDLTIVECSASYDNKNVGTGKTVTFTGFSLAGDAATNYKLIAQPTSVTADITVKEITINGAAVESSKVYDGTTDAKITNAGTPSENYDGDNLTIVAGSATYDNKNVGTGKTVTFSGFSLAGDAAANYKLIAQPTSVTADITVKEITINGATVESSKIYDGTTDAKITNAGTPSENYDGDNLTIVAGSASYDNKNVGTGKTVTFTNFALAGDAAMNYKLIAQPTSVTADITVKEITIDNLKVKDKEYDGTSRAELDGTPGIVGKVDGDEVELVNGTPSFDTVTVKRDIAISFTEFTLRGRDAANYTLKQPSGITASIVEYVANGSEYSVNSNDWINTDFIVTAADGWQLSLTDSADGIWTETLTAADETDSGSLEFYVKNTTTGVISTVIREQYKIDLKAPTGEVKLNERNAFQTILNKISFGLFFNADVSVKITAADEASGVSSIMYYMSDSVLEAADVRAIADWTEGSNFGITAEDSAKFIVYVRIEDNAGNISYIGSDGAIFDTTAPEIIGVEDGHTYYVTKRVAVDDDNLAEVTLNDDAVDHVFTIAGDTDATYLIKATDEAGNVTEYKVYMKTIASITDAVSAITVDNVKSDDAETVASVAQQIMTIGETFDEEESTADEWAKIVAASAKCKELEERISATAAESDRLSDGVGAYSIETVKSTDKADIEALLNDTVKLLDGDNLTESERDEVEDIKAALEALLGKLSSVKDAAEDPDITDVSGITKDTVKSEDKDDLEKAKDALKDSLDDFDGNLTDDERDDLERKLDDIEKALEAIENAEDASDEIKKLPDPDDVKLSDKDDVKRVSEIVDSLTDNEKTMLGDEAVRKITKLGEKIAELEKISFAPSIIEGAGQKWSENSDKDALFRSNAEFDEFVKVLVDGTEIDDSCYKAYAGSTVVELRADYLKTLSAGEHTLSIVSKNGRADTTFTVLEENAGDAPQTDNDSTGNGGNSTQTGDGFIMQFALLFISGGAVIGTAIAAKKRKEEE